MADTIKIGSLDISAFKVGSSDCKIYLGDTLLYPQTVTPKLTAYYSDGSVYQLSCNTSTTLTQSEVRAHTTSYTAMTSVVVGDCVTTIGQNAFRMGNYTAGGSLSSITLSNSVKTINTQAFSFNSALKTFEMPNNVTSLGNSVFYYCTSLSSVTLSQNITGISSGLFKECESLKSVVIPSGVTSIGQTAFYNCKNLASLEIPNSVTTIQNRAFARMGQSITSGASITIGSGVTSIGYGAFVDFGTALTAATNVVTIYAATPPSMILSTASTVNNRWGFSENTVVYVPCDSVNAYKADEYWGKYASQIEAIPDSCTGQTLQWVTFSNGDTIPSDLEIYGISGAAYDFYATFGSSSAMGDFIPSRNRIEISLYCDGNPCYSDNPFYNDNVELIFSNIGCCDYYNQGAIVSGGDLGVGVIKLYIYA